MSLDSTKADDIALVIEEAIVSGELAPGTVLRQEQLSEQFNVSRTPIREALRRLAALGLVSFVPNRGVRVRTLSRDELHEAFLVRAELEGLATEAAAAKITPEQLDELDAAEKRFATISQELRAREPELLGGDVVAAVPLLLELAALVREGARHAVQHVLHECVRVVHRLARVVDEPRLDLLPAVAERAGVVADEELFVVLRRHRTRSRSVVSTAAPSRDNARSDVSSRSSSKRAR